MQPPAATIATENAAQAASRTARTRALSAGGFLSLDRLDNLSLLKRHGRLLHDRFVAAQSVLNIDRRPEVAAEHHRLEMHLVVGADDCDARALCVDDRGGR